VCKIQNTVANLEKHRRYFFLLQQEHPLFALIPLIPGFMLGFKLAKSAKTGRMVRTATRFALLNGFKLVTR
jgi:hypothetical protein